MPLTQTPLATADQFNSGAFKDLARSIDPDWLDQIMLQATRQLEAECGRRLAPFTVTETHRAEGVDPDELGGSADLPIDFQGTVGMSYANALGAVDLVRHLWLNEYPPVFQDHWTYSNLSVTVVRSYGGQETFAGTRYIGPEPDSGHVWFNLGSFIPLGSLLRATYSGGYTTVPANLTRACLYMAASIVARELDPMVEQHGHSPEGLEDRACKALKPYMRT